MITIKYKETNKGFRIDLEGHADSPFSKIGEDGVCSAVSVLTSTLARSVTDAERAGMLTDKPVVNLGEDGCGVGRVSCRVDRRYHATMRILFGQIVNGYMLMALNFPSEVKFIRN